MSVLDRSDLEASPLADLHVIASELGLDGFRRLRKADLIDAIVARQGGDGEKAGADDAAAEAEPEAEDTTEGPEPDADADAGGDTETERPRRRRRGRRGRGRRNAEREAEEDGGADAGTDDGRRAEPRDRASRDRGVAGAVEPLGP